MTDLTPEKLAELRRDAESWLMIGGERVLPLLNALDAARAERDALAAKLAVVLALLADAWDECKHSEHTPACRLGDGNCTCPNPYQPEGETHE